MSACFDRSAQAASAGRQMHHRRYSCGGAGMPNASTGEHGAVCANAGCRARLQSRLLCARCKDVAYCSKGSFRVFCICSHECMRYLNLSMYLCYMISYVCTSSLCVRVLVWAQNVRSWRGRRGISKGACQRLWAQTHEGRRWSRYVDSNTTRSCH